MAGPQTGPENQADAITAAHEAAGNFCVAGDPFAPNEQVIAAQMLGEPIPQARQQT